MNVEDYGKALRAALPHTRKLNPSDEPRAKDDAAAIAAVAAGIKAGSQPRHAFRREGDAQKAALRALNIA